jgi:N-acyl-phosphatidylethanolamine-hydrolysing phospholipase D
LGHATFLLQIGSSTVLTDPIFSARASPFAFAGPSRFLPSPLTVAELPPVDAVVLSHDHYDHLDERSVRALDERFGAGLTWVTPLGYADWFGARGISRVVELDWWQGTEVSVPGGAVGGPVGTAPETPLRIDAAPAQHWSRRGLEVNQRLWASFALRSGGRSVYFGGDSGYFNGYAEIGSRLGPFDLALMPIGAYEPRWFMKAAHMNPEEAVQAFRELGQAGAFIGMHWGTFRLTDEAPLEPPERARAAWVKAGLRPEALCEPGIGGTVRIPPG